MALEVVRPADEPTEEARRAFAQKRAALALESFLGKLTPESSPATDGTEDDELVDIRDDDGAEAVPGWVTVAEAATKAGVSTSTVRHWYRTGNLATQRRDGDRGAFLVPVDDVLRLADAADVDGAVIEDSVIDINARYWAVETEAARAAAEEAQTEVRRLEADLLDARVQIETARDQLRLARSDAAAAESAAAALEREVAFLRSQLVEANEEAESLKEQLEEATRSAVFGSVTSSAWVEAAPDGYRGPLRPQEPLTDGPGERLDDLLPASGHRGRQKRKS